MKKIKEILLGLSLVLLCSNPLWAASKPENAEPVRTPTGLEWLQKSIGGRFDDVVASMALLHQNGVPMRLGPYDYCTVVQKEIRKNPSLNDTELTAILADYLYRKEPEARPFLDGLKGQNQLKR